jgi:transcriptional regulator with XRE-family HTH domain
MTPGRWAAIHAAEAAMSELGWTQAQLAEQSRLNVRVINSFLNGRNWPQSRTRAQIEVALKWPVGTLARIEKGGEPPRGRVRDPEELRRLITEMQEELTWLNPRFESTRRVITARLEREIADLKRELEAIDRSDS